MPLGSRLRRAGRQGDGWALAAGAPAALASLATVPLSL